MHRDVKPGNVLVTPEGRVKLTDFGIAKAVERRHDDLTAENVMMGTAKYLSPEQVLGFPLDGRADLYSLGLVLYECLTGKVAFTGATDGAIAIARLQRDPAPIRQVAAGGAAGRRRRGHLPPGPPTRGPPGHRRRGPRHAGRGGQRARRRHPAAAAPAAVTARRRPSASRRPARRIRTSTTTSRPRGAVAVWP